MLFRVGRSVVISGCLFLTGAGVAAAADIPYPVKSPPPVVVPDSWAGFYVGGQIGYGDDGVRWRNLGASTFYSPLNSVTHDRGNGVIGGGQVGYNFQVNRFVFGVEGSISAADFDRSFASPYNPATDVWSSKVTWLSTATGRIGYGFDSWMPYVKAGLAVANVDTSIANTVTGVTNQGSAVHYGWTAGGGVEFKVAPKFSLGLEYMHTELSRGNDINGPSTAGATENYGVGLRSDSLMARFNYLFGR
jgi:outer membrane immunogenic protein